MLGLVGKGITFDTGGISIKPADGMERMKDDMAGGAAVAGAMCALARLERAAARSSASFPTAENMPGGTAIRPGDVVRGASGKTVEIINTDAEGRLILGDALWYAQQLGATHLVDVATLTGACVVALGRHVSGLFGTAATPGSNTSPRRRRSAGDRVWPHADLRGSARAVAQRDRRHHQLGRPAGRAPSRPRRSCASSPATSPWAHLDIAGTAWAESKEAYQPKGATGVAVRLLTALGMTAVTGGVRNRRTDGRQLRPPPGGAGST